VRFTVHPLKQLISQGEGLTLDFKQTISSSRKIAKTLAAFANTNGGRLLIGVKDNGRIVGCAVQEELYMIESAARVFAKPPIPYEAAVHEMAGGSQVLEVEIPKSTGKPHYAKDEQGKWWATIRVEDQTITASKVLLDVMKREQAQKETVIQYSEEEQRLLAYLNEHGRITLKQYTQLLKIPRFKAIHILVNLIVVGVLSVHITQSHEFYVLNPLAETVDMAAH